jgi:uncharacterized caspase-like protein
VASQRRALIVANDRYEQEGLRNLRAPAADAEGLRRVLGDPQIGAFAVQVVRNQPAHVIHAQIEELFLESKPDDVLLLHFSCHGLKGESGELFFAAANTRPDRLGSTAVSADFVQRCMRATRSRTVVLLLDCCYGGAFAQGVTVRASGDVQVLDSFPRERLGGGRGRAVITASGAMEFAMEGTRLADDSRRRRPSVFTAALIEGLRTGDADHDQDGWISLDELYDYVFDKVREQTPNQTPNRHIELAGEMYLARNPKLPSRPNLRAPTNDPGTLVRLASGARPAAAGADQQHGRPSTADVSVDSPAELSLRIEPISEPIEPVPDWRSQLVVSDEPVEIRRPPQPRKSRRGTWRLAACIILWATLSIWALRGHLADWLPLSLLSAGIACAAGSSTLSKVYNSDHETLESDLAYWSFIVGTVASLAAMIAGPVAALGLTIYAEITGHSLEQRVLLGVALFALLGCIGAGAAESFRRGEYRKSLAEWHRATDLSDERLSKRWLADQADWEPTQSLISPLLPIRAVRFTRLPADDAEFAAVAGDRVLLVWRVSWQPGKYTLGHGGTREIFRDGAPQRDAIKDARRLADKSVRWSKRLRAESEEAQIGSLVIVNGITGQASPSLGFRHDGDLTYVTPEEFGDSAGGFLVKSQQFIDALLLANMLRHVKHQ